MNEGTLLKAFRAAVPENGVVHVEEFEPPYPGAGEVLIQTRATLISPGTERAFFLGLPNASLPFPIYPGYSNVGEVIALGEGVTVLQRGQRVVSPAAHASHAVMRDAQCLLVPPDLSDESAAFFNLIAIAMQAVHKARIELGESVVVIGAGMIGLFAMQLARLSGGLPVITIDLDDSRLELAKTLGADEAYTTYEGQANVIIEATGAPTAIRSALQMASQRGRVLLLGSSRGDTDGINFYRDVHRKGISIIGAHEINRPQVDNAPGFWRQIDEQRIGLELLVRGRMSTQGMVTHRFVWRDFPQAYDLLVDGGAMGMLIEWQS